LSQQDSASNEVENTVKAKERALINLKMFIATVN
jgi:hypothetical protein